MAMPIAQKPSALLAACWLLGHSHPRGSPGLGLGPVPAAQLPSGSFFLHRRQKTGARRSQELLLATRSESEKREPVQARMNEVLANQLGRRDAAMRE
jgi:hypothetical protein